MSKDPNRPLKGADEIAGCIGVSRSKFFQVLRDEMLEYGAVYYVNNRRGRQLRAQKATIREFLQQRENRVI